MTAAQVLVPFFIALLGSVSPARFLSASAKVTSAYTQTREGEREWKHGVTRCHPADGVCTLS